MKNENIELFMPFSGGCSLDSLQRVADSPRVKQIYLWCSQGGERPLPSDKIATLAVASLSDTRLFAEMARLASADCVLCFLKEPDALPRVENLLEMCDEMDESASMLYSDYRKIVGGETVDAPTIDYQEGSLRNDFDFGSLVLLRTAALKKYLSDNLPPQKYAGFYQLRLALSRVGRLQHFARYVYTEQEPDTRRSGEKQFDYVNPVQRAVQIEMEAVCTDHLKRVGAWLPPYKYEKTDLSNGDFPVEASVVVPVLNRAATIADAIRSVLAQKTSFPFNILVVDNHSTDGTGAIIDSFHDKRVCHIIPRRNNLGIGGCWNLAVRSRRCGRFAVQLDSDDLYSDENTLQRIVDEFYKQQCAMLVGSYRICDFNLDTLPPGIIDHREWTEENGRNNALRINGLGAPRAFYTPIVRKLGFPNVSYGEDYAVGLQISRRYKIGRIYDVLYLCRRWDGNSDAALSQQKINAHNSYKDSLRTAEYRARVALMKKMRPFSLATLKKYFAEQLKAWPDVAARFSALESVSVRHLPCGVTLQHNPARILSTAAKVDDSSIKRRACFLCDENRPQEQLCRVVLGNVQVLVNPYPVLPFHFTLPIAEHRPQTVARLYGDMLTLAKRWRGMALFYNGAKCGASAPDHAHLQAVRAADVPLLRRDWQRRIAGGMRPVCAVGGSVIFRVTDYIIPLFIIEAVTADESAILLNRLLAALPHKRGEAEPRLNILTVYRKGHGLSTYLFPRAEHRPSCYFAEGEGQRLVSPGLLDVAGLMIVPRSSDFDRLPDDEAVSILREVAIDDATADTVERKLLCGK